MNLRRWDWKRLRVTSMLQTVTFHKQHNSPAVHSLVTIFTQRFSFSRSEYPVFLSLPVSVLSNSPNFTVIFITQRIACAVLTNDLSPFELLNPGESAFLLSISISDGKLSDMFPIRWRNYPNKRQFALTRGRRTLANHTGLSISPWKTHISLVRRARYPGCTTRETRDVLFQVPKENGDMCPGECPSSVSSLCGNAFYPYNSPHLTPVF